MKFGISLSAAALVAMSVAASMPASASTQSFTALSSSVDGKATFQTSDGGNLLVTLENLWTSSFSATQSISGVDFAIKGLPSLASGSVRFESGDLVRYTGGTFKDLTDPVAGAASYAWNLSFAGGTLKLNALASGVGKNGPDLTIDPDPQLYSANSSIKNGPHNDFFRGPVTFSLSVLTGVDSHSLVQDVFVRFGTNGTPVHAVPEPETWALLLAGLTAVGFVARRRKSA